MKEKKTVVSNLKVDFKLKRRSGNKLFVSDQKPDHETYIFEISIKFIQVFFFIQEDIPVRPIENTMRAPTRYSSKF